MASGTITLSQSSPYFRGRVVWSSTQNINGNYSTVTATVQISRTDSGNTTKGVWTGNVHAWNIINGDGVYYLPTQTISKQLSVSSSWVTVESYTFTVPHYNNGYGECLLWVSVYGPEGTSLYGQEVRSNYREGDRISLGTIPRAAEITSAPNFNDEESPTVQYKNPAGNAVSSLAICITFEGNNDDIAYREISKTETTYTFELTEEERKKLRQYTVWNTERQVGFYLRTTLTNGNVYYSKAWRNFYIVNALPNMQPTVEDTNATTLALTGNKNRIIKGHNTVSFNSGAEVYKEAVIASQKVVCGSASATTGSGTLTNVESNVFKFTLIDSRNNTVEKTVTKTLVNYVELTSKLEVQAPTTDGKTSFTVSGNFFNASFGAITNTLTVQYRYKANDGSYGAWTTVSTTPSGNAYSATVNLTGLNYLNTYTFEVKVLDKLNTIIKSKTVKTVPVFDWSDSDFNFNVPIAINGVVIDYIVEQGTKNGWEYRKWNSGVAECWKIVTLNTAASAQWGALWRGDSFLERQTYPFNFTAKPTENVTVQSSSVGAWVLPMDSGNGVNGASASGRYTICRPASTVSAEYYFSFHVIGKWK